MKTDRELMQQALDAIGHFTVMFHIVDEKGRGTFAVAEVGLRKE